MPVATLAWGLTLALGFELARRGRHFDYRAFTKALLGPVGWRSEFFETATRVPTRTSTPE